jgi:WD40 repeat-containing protein SMU1
MLGCTYFLCSIHGLKSGKMIKEFRGHTAYVTQAIFDAEGHRVISGDADGLVKASVSIFTDDTIMFIHHV